MHAETLSKNTRIVLGKIAPIVKQFYLAGGTALALEFGHRISVDLDFFSQDSFSVPVLIEKLNDLGDLKIEDQSEDTFNGSLDGVKISFFHYPYPLLFETKDYEGVSIADERDISAMKIQAISGRGSKKDFVDFFVLLKKYSIKELLDFFHEKYKKFDYNLLHILKSLNYFFNADRDPNPEMLINDIWKDMKKHIDKEVLNYLNKK